MGQGKAYNVDMSFSNGFYNFLAKPCSI